MALTAQEPKAGLPQTLTPDSAVLPKRSWVKISQIRTLSLSRLSSAIGRVPPEVLNEVIEGLNEIIQD